MASTYLQKGIRFLDFDFVRTKQAQSAVDFRLSESILVALQELERVLDDDRLQVDFFPVVKVFGLQLNL